LEGEKNAALAAKNSAETAANDQKDVFDAEFAKIAPLQTTYD